MGAELEIAVSDAQREAALDHLRQAVASSNLGLEVFANAVTAVLAAPTVADLASVLEQVAPVARLTPAHRRHAAPVVLEVHSGRLTLGPSWQVARHTKVVAGSGRVVLDLADAEFDAPVVDLDLSCQSGSITVFVPIGVEVQFAEMAGQSGSVRNEVGAAAALPGAPLLRVRARTVSGRVVFRRPPPAKAETSRRRFWRRRSAVGGYSG